MSEIAPVYFFTHTNSSRPGPFLADTNFQARAAMTAPQNRDPWPMTTTDAEGTARIFEADSGHHGQSGGDLPFLDAVDPNRLNAFLDEQSDNPQQGLRFSVLHTVHRERALGGIFAVATVSPAGGFRQETLKHAIRRLKMSTPASLPPLSPSVNGNARGLHVATLPDTLLPLYDQAAQNGTRGLLGAMVAYHALKDLDPATVIQYAYLSNRPGAAYRAVLRTAMGMESYAADTIIHAREQYAISQRFVGVSNRPGGILNSLVDYIEQTHSIGLRGA